MPDIDAVNRLMDGLKMGHSMSVEGAQRQGRALRIPLPCTLVWLPAEKGHVGVLEAIEQQTVGAIDISHELFRTPGGFMHISEEVWVRNSREANRAASDEVRAQHGLDEDSYHLVLIGVGNQVLDRNTDRRYGFNASNLFLPLFRAPREKRRAKLDFRDLIGQLTELASSAGDAVGRYRTGDSQLGPLAVVNKTRLTRAQMPPPFSSEAA